VDLVQIHSVLDGLYFNRHQILFSLLSIYLCIYLLNVLIRNRRELAFQKQISNKIASDWESKVEHIFISDDEEVLQEKGWHGIRKFIIDKKILECEGICSFYLKPLDEGYLSDFKPGQFLTFELPINNKIITRCYSLSDKYQPDYYRISVKHAKHPPKQPEIPDGLSSSYFHTQLSEGDIINVRAPDGHFYLQRQSNKTPVLLSSGVGITPVMSMLETLLAEHYDGDIWFFLGVRSSVDHPFKDHLEQISEHYPQVKLVICYSRPDENDLLNRDYHVHGRLNADVLKAKLPDMDNDYYICGPGPMMDGMIKGLIEYLVDEQHIYFEAFANSAHEEIKTSIDRAVINFEQSEKQEIWTKDDGVLLEFIENHEIEINSACRAGNCGSCKAKVVSGEVEYIKKPGYDIKEGECLTCISTPKTDLILDL